ncbi:MAG: hypothetical protein M3Y26_09290 [Actinomycetota bacterium]|nr:hypothetical protein [Actinomycetota bacterium]
MTDAGCPMVGSAIFKIEKADPPRRIVVDELVTFAKVFGVTIQDLLLPPEVVASRELTRLVAEWDAASTSAAGAIAARDLAWRALRDFSKESPEAKPVLERWANIALEDGSSEETVANRMWYITRDPEWGKRAKATMDLAITDEIVNEEA